MLARGSGGTHLPVSPGTEEADFPASPGSTAEAQEGRTPLRRLLRVQEVLTELYRKDFISPEVFAGFTM